uniref:Uncharacterized protein n=1 Tax=Aegilops tauschii TaxID=37682 RepID=N1R577_AEGTA
MSEHGQGVEEGRRKAARKCWKATKTAVIKDTWVPLLTLPWKCAFNCLCCSCRQAGIEASRWVWHASYNGTSLGLAGNSLPGSFQQGPKNTTVLHAVFQGMVTVVDVQVQEGLAKELERERGSGAVRVRVRVDLTIMYKVIVKEIFFYSYECYLPFTPLPNAVFLSDSAPCFRV